MWMAVAVCDSHVQSAERLRWLGERQLCPQQCQEPCSDSQNCWTSWVGHLRSIVFARQRLVLCVCTLTSVYLEQVTLICSPL